MKFDLIGHSISSSFLVGLVSVLSSSTDYAGTMGPQVASMARPYVSVFGGGGASTKTDVSQYGTAFFTEADGGPLAVNAFGRTDSRNAGFVGANVGYQWTEVFLDSFHPVSGFSPATELEGYYLTRSTFSAHDLNNDTIRLPEHDFLVRYPMSAGVFLVNALANVNLSNCPKLHPYIGAGIGAGILSISNATATQVSPPEVGVNHYNSNTSDKDATFAAQVKLGLNYDINPNISFFAEYRWLHFSDSNYVFGSTSYPTHAATSSWLVNFDPQNYNMGGIGLRYNF